MPACPLISTTHDNTGQWWGLIALTPRGGFSWDSTESFHRSILSNRQLSLASLRLHRLNIAAKMDHSKGLDIAFEEAKQSYSEGGIPVRMTSISASEIAIMIFESQMF
jgi:hypothetical protein